MVIKISYPITASILITLKQITVLNVNNSLLNSVTCYLTVPANLIWCITLLSRL